MHTTYCEEDWEKSGNIPNCRRNLFSHPGNLARTEKCLKGFMISAHCTSHGVQANQVHKTNKQQILAEFLRCAHVCKHQNPLGQNVCVSPPPPHFTCHTSVSSTKDIKRVNKNIRRLLAVTGPCSWMRHNFSQFPR